MWNKRQSSQIKEAAYSRNQRKLQMTDMKLFTKFQKDTLVSPNTVSLFLPFMMLPSFLEIYNK